MALQQLGQDHWFDTSTGKHLTYAELNEAQTKIRKDRLPLDPFTDAYKKDPSNYFQENPYNTGTEAYENFAKEQIRSKTELAGMPKAPEFINSSSAGYQGFGPKVEAGTLSGPDNVQFNSNPLSLVAGSGTPIDWFNQLTGAASAPSDDQTPSLTKLLPYAAGTVGATLGSRDTSGYDALKNRALSSNDSAWLSLSKQRQQGEEAGRLDEANRQAAGANAEAQSNLAMRGGLNSGAGERIQMASMEDALKNMQGIRNAGQNERLSLNIADEATKTGLLSQLPGESRAQTDQLLKGTEYLTNLGSNENALAADIGFKNISNNQGAKQFNVTNRQDVEKGNIGNYLNEMLQKRAQQNFQYGEQAKAYGAEKTGEAISGAGKK